MSLITDLTILFSEKMVGRDAPVLAQTLDLLPQAIALSGQGANLIPNGSFELWPGDITNIAPIGFSLKGAPTDVSRDTGERDGYGGTFAVKITSNGAGNEGITITLSELKASTEYALQVRVKATAGDTARIWTTGGSSNADKNTTSTSFVTLEDTFTTDATPTNVILNLGSNTATDIVWFDQLVIQEGEIPAVFSPERALLDSIVQIRYTQTGAVNTGSTAMPIDDTIPQNTEGDEYMTLAITPTNANNKLLIEASFQGANSAVNHVGVALFQDATANALAAQFVTVPAANQSFTTFLRHEMTAGTTSVTTFKIRAGRQNTGTITFNGLSGSRIFGGVMASSIRITEIKQ